MPRSQNSKISREICAAVREQQILRNVPEHKRSAPCEPPPIEQRDQLLRQANLRLQPIEEAIQAQQGIIPPQLLTPPQLLALQLVGGIYRPAPVREVPAPVREVPAPVREVPAPAREVPAPVRDIPAQDEDILQIKYIEEDE